MLLTSITINTFFEFKIYDGDLLDVHSGAAVYCFNVSVSSGSCATEISWDACREEKTSTSKKWYKESWCWCR